MTNDNMTTETDNEVCMAVRIRMKKMGRKHRPFFRDGGDRFARTPRWQSASKSWGITTRW